MNRSYTSPVNPLRRGLLSLKRSKRSSSDVENLWEVPQKDIMQFRLHEASFSNHNAFLNFIRKIKNILHLYQWHEVFFFFSGYQGERISYRIQKTLAVDSETWVHTCSIFFIHSCCQNSLEMTWRWSHSEPPQPADLPHQPATLPGSCSVCLCSTDRACIKLSVN